MSDPLFIASPVSVLTGDAARVALAQTNDAAHYTPGKGVLSVPLERWQKAQEYERATWLNQGLSMTEDRNSEHDANFGGYRALPRFLGRVIELGCGPFTNVARMTAGRKMYNPIVLLDPLFEDYMLNHPHCRYKDGMLNRDWIVKGHCVSIEEYKTGQVYDTVIMINVLSHCQSVDAVFGWINDHLREGGHLVFHEPARDIDVLKVYDAGHPLSYTQAVIDDFLAGYTEVYRKGDYFIGVKK